MNEMKIRLREILSIVIDAIFLCVWILVQALVAYVIQEFSIDQWVLWCFRVVFGLSTLTIVIIWMYMDVRIMWIRAKKRIEQEQHQLYSEKVKDTVKE